MININVVYSDVSRVFFYMKKLHKLKKLVQLFINWCLTKALELAVYFWHGGLFLNPALCRCLQYPSTTHSLTAVVRMAPRSNNI